MSGSWSAAELPHRVSQKYVEAILRRHADALPSIELNYGWRLLDYADKGAAGVVAEVECVADGRKQTIHARYLVGADGPRSFVRQSLGISYLGATGIQRDFMGGRMLAVYLRSPDFQLRVPHPKAWMYVCFNQDRRAYMAAVNGKDEYAFHTQLRPGEDETKITEADARQAFQRACGAPIVCEVMSFLTWTAGHVLVAERMQQGNIFIGGDAAHLFTPAGGLGYNTAIEDAVNLGWKLASVVKGTSDVTLLESYEIERRPVAVRNTGYARQFADSLGLYVAPPEIEEDSERGRAARHAASVHFNQHARAEFNIPGVTFGGRYDGSPIIIADGTSPPPDAANNYVPTACPGGRAPHAWLDGDTSLFDTFGFEWTLLRLGADTPDGSVFRDAAASIGAGLRIVTTPANLRDLYQADLALIRPDQIVAWRGNIVSRVDAAAIMAQATGNHLAIGKRLSG
jgi:2-polyprenyl-6-methoxyphenol hydroxylase-like FAD-dependent oxidoreductase